MWTVSQPMNGSTPCQQWHYAPHSLARCSTGHGSMSCASEGMHFDPDSCEARCCGRCGTLGHASGGFKCSQELALARCTSGWMASPLLREAAALPKCVGLTCVP